LIAISALLLTLAVIVKLVKLSRTTALPAPGGSKTTDRLKVGGTVALAVATTPKYCGQDTGESGCTISVA